MDRRGISIPSKITWGVFLSLLGVALTAVIVGQFLSGRHAERQYTEVLKGWVEIGARQVGEAATGRRDLAGARPPITSGDNAAARQFRRWAWSVLAKREAVATLLLGPQGKVLARMPEKVAVAGLNALPVAGDVCEMTSLRVGGVDQDVYVVARPVHRAHDHGPVGRVMLLAAPRVRSFDVAGLIIMFGCLVLVIIPAVTLTYAWARRAVGCPLDVLSRPEDRQGPGWAAALPVDADDEWGEIARTLASRMERTARAEARSDALEKTIQSRVTDKTKRMKTMLQQAEKRAWVDPLTGLHNRRFLDEKLELLFQEQAAAGEDLTLVMFDIDHFKRLNDTLGHAEGDNLLAFVGELLRGALRSSDVGVRYGGDEFLALLIGTGPADAVAIAERIVRLFRQHASLLPVQPPVSFSAGVASISIEHVSSGADLLKRADNALYRAKHAGKNAVVTYAAPLSTNR